MSMNGVASLYEKMLTNPNLRKSSQGSVKQPNPYADLGMSDPNLVDESAGLSADEVARMAAIDSRMAKRQEQGYSEPAVDESRINKLEKDVSELRDLMMHMMKTHMELLEKKNG